ncbi:MAG: pSer/pThr/pTyr-binding forkhead associated (FHA) protein [Planctomycetota bacterium]|jgi:pSer/pThr/pTyr-binding forkhead associated (FHA) protein
MPEFILEIGNSVERRSVDSNTIVFGRDLSCDVVIDDGSISRQHAVVEKTNARWILKDLGSGNGVFIDGAKVRRVVLTRGSQFSLGEIVAITFLSDSDEVVEQEQAEVEKEVVAGPNEDLSAAPPVDGYEAIEVLGKGPRATSYAFRKQGSKTTTCFRHVTADIDHKELEKLIADWNEVDHEAVTRLDLIRSDNNQLLIRERYSDLGNLSEFIASKGRMDLDLALKISRTLAVGLDALHDSGVRLGRMRPEKVRVTSEDGAVRISGPGVIAVAPELIGDSMASHLSCMAPEFFGEGVSQRPTRRGDIFALGAIMHQLFVGVGVGEGKTVEGMQRSILRGLLKTPDERRRGLPEGLSDLICSCLSQDPNQRPLTASDVLELLSNMMVQVVARAPSRPVQAAEREMGQRQGHVPKSLRHRSISWAITIVLFLMVNAAVILVYKDKLGIFGESEPDYSQSGPLLSDIQPGSRGGGLVGEVERLIEADQFDKALAKIQGALADRSIDSSVAAPLEDLVSRKRTNRVFKLTERIERALSQSQRAKAGGYLQTLLDIVGPADSEYQRLLKQVEGN